MPILKRQNILLFFAILLVAVGVIFSINRIQKVKSVEIAKRGIAVLPFTSETDSGKYDYFTDGVTEELIDMLSVEAELTVISRNTMTLYKHTQKSIQEIGKELNVDLILYGTIQRYVNHDKIVCSLISVSNGNTIWLKYYDKQVENIFDIERDITANTFRYLDIQRPVTVQHSPLSTASQNYIAYDYYLKAREQYYHFKPEDNEIAIRLFTSALSIDTNYVLAMAGLSDAYSQRVAKFGYPTNWLDTAIMISTNAIALDSNVAEAYKAQALAYSGKGWHSKAINTYLKAVQLNPNYFTAVGNLGTEYYFIGKYDKAMIWHKRALPLNPKFAFSYNSIGGTYSNLYDYRSSEEWFKKVKEIQPDFQYVHCGYCLIYLRQGDAQHSVQEIETVLSTTHNDLEALTYAGWSHLFLQQYDKAEYYFKQAITIDSLGTYWYGLGRSSTTALGYIYLKKGNKSLADAMFDRSRHSDQIQLDHQSEWFTLRYDLAAINAIEGNTSEAIRWLTKAKELGWRDYQLSQRDPLLEHLHGQNDFEQLLNELKQLNIQMLKMVNEVERM